MPSFRLSSENLKENPVNAQPNRRFFHNEPSDLTVAFIDSEITYLDSFTNYRESLQDVLAKNTIGDLVLQDDEERFPWSALIISVLVVAAALIIIFFLTPVLNL